MKNFLKNIKAGINAGTIIMLAVAFLLVTILAPIALDEIADADTTGWGAAVITIFTILLPILFIIGVAIKFIPRGGGKGDMLRNWLWNKKAEVNAAAVIMLAVALLLVTILVPIGMTEIVKYNASTRPLWATSVLTIFTVLLPILFIIGVAIRFIPRGK